MSCTDKYSGEVTAFDPHEDVAQNTGSQRAVRGMAWV